MAIPTFFVALVAGTDTVTEALNAIPEVVTRGLQIAGGFIVVVGYAMVINMMRAGALMPFFFPRLRDRLFHQLQPCRSRYFRHIA